jgi:hypothetical protein
MPTAKQISATTRTGTATFGGGPGRFADNGCGADGATPWGARTFWAV